MACPAGDGGTMASAPRAGTAYCSSSVPGSQQIVIQTREDGVSIDQVVLSAEEY